MDRVDTLGLTRWRTSVLLLALLAYGVHDMIVPRSTEAADPIRLTAPQRHQLNELANEIDKDWQAGRKRDAWQSLERLLAAEESDLLVSWQGRWVHPAQLAIFLRGQLNSGEQRQFDSQFDAAALALWRDYAARHDQSIFDTVVRRYPWTRTGLMAQSRMAQNKLDAGHFHSAANSFRRIQSLAEPDSDLARQASRGLLISRFFSGDRTLDANSENMSLKLAGSSRPWTEWHRELSLKFPVASDSTAGIAPAPEVSFLAQQSPKSWHRPLIDQNQFGDAKLKNDFSKRGEVGWSNSRLAYDQESIYFIQGQSLRSVNRASGKAGWSQPLAAETITHQWVQHVSDHPAGQVYSSGGKLVVVANRITAHQPVDGKILWTLDGPQLHGSSMGDGVLYGVIWPDPKSMKVAAIDLDDGKIAWSLVVGEREDPARLTNPDTSPDQDRNDLFASWMCARTKRIGDRLYVSSRHGTLTAIDLLNRCVLWTTSLPMKANFLDPDGPARMATGWREGDMVGIDHRVFVASRELEHLFAIDSNTGTVLWKTPRDKGVALGRTPGYAGGILVHEAFGLRMQDVATGRVLWRTPTPLLTGSGWGNHEYFWQPTEQGVTVIRLKDGAAVAASTPLRSPFAEPQPAVGNLARIGNGWLSHSVEMLSYYPGLIADSKQPPATASESINQLRAGNVATVWQAIRDQSNPEYAGIKFECALLGIRRGLWTPQDVESHVQLAKRDVEDQLRWFDATAGSTRANREDRLAAILNALSLVLNADNATLAVPATVASPDDPHDCTWLSRFQGHLDRFPSENALLMPQEEQSLRQWISATPDQLIDRAYCLAGSSTGMKLVVEHELPQGPLDLRWDRLWQRLAEAGDAKIKDFARKQIDIEARQFRRGRPVADPPFGVSPSLVTSTRNFRDDIHGALLRLESTVGPLTNEMDVWVDRNQKFLRFLHSDRPGSWTVDLPRNFPNFRYIFDRHVGWIQGRLLIVRIGHEVLAIDPLDHEQMDDHGQVQPVARIVWRHVFPDLAARLPVIHRAESLPSADGASRSSEVDGMGSEVAEVLAVHPTGVLILDGGQLTSLDLLTGVPRWSRKGVLAGTRTLASSSTAVLVAPDSDSLEWFSMIDGSRLGNGHWPHDGQEVLASQGTLCWHITTFGDEKTGHRLLSATDLAGKEAKPVWREMWSRKFSRQALVTMADETTIAVVEGNQLLLIDGITGSERIVPLAISLDEPARKLIVTADRDRWYVTVAAEVPSFGKWYPIQILGGYRLQLVRGEWLAIERAAGAVAWRQSLAPCGQRLDQPRVGPFLIQAYRTPNPGGDEAGLPSGVIRIVERASGREMFRWENVSQHPFVLIESDPWRSLVGVVTERFEVVFDYRKIPPPPAKPR